MNSDLLKNEILKYFRFKRQFYLCATEVNNGFEIADILVSNGKKIIEIEIKISYSDFLADFKKRKHKKVYIGNNIYRLDYLKANKFYFCIPHDLKEKCLEYLNKNNLPYGLYVFNGSLNLVKKCKILKELHIKEIDKINKNIIRRATSELIILRLREEIKHGI